MISIISGQYKGRKLNHIKNLYVRPTQAKVRKSIFQILEPLDGMKILDLYAGVGTLGIEAMSRGASQVVFVEKNKKVFNVLKKNLELFDSKKYKIFLTDVLKFINYLNKDYYDIILADPPYSEIKYDFLKEKVENLLAPNGIFCMEMKKETIKTSRARIKYYGSTQVVFWSA